MTLDDHLLLSGRTRCSIKGPDRLRDGLSGCPGPEAGLVVAYPGGQHGQSGGAGGVKASTM